GLYVLVDSSASRALGWSTQVRRLTDLIAGLRDGAGSGTPLGIAAFDQEVAPIFEGTAGGFGTAEVQSLGARRPLGAADLNRALVWLADRLAHNRERYPRVLLLTDGVATAGDVETRTIKAAVKALRAHGVERLDVLAVGGLRDEAVLRALTTGNLEHDGQRIDGDASLAEISRRLTLACRSGIPVTVEGAAWVWPDTLDGVQPGDAALVYADLPAGKPLRLSLAGRPAAPGGELAEIERPLLQRAWAQARIERLLHLRDTEHAADDDLRRAIVREVTDLSIRHRVLSPYTALLVLETEFDYARFGLDRRALADILTIGPGGLDVLHRKLPGAVSGDRLAREIPKPVTRDFDSFAEDQGEEIEGDVEPGVEGGVEGGVAGGVVGGVAGGVPGGTPGGVVGGVPSQPVDVA